jgi:hypothetical protein
MNTRTGTVALADHRVFKAPAPDGRRSGPQAGDILVCERSARADVFSISIIPGDTEVIVSRYSEALECVQVLARARRVDGWYTCDQTHYARIASCRP